MVYDTAMQTAQAVIALIEGSLILSRTAGDRLHSTPRRSPPARCSARQLDADVADYAPINRSYAAMQYLNWLAN